jgi:hypothetical protein
MDTLGKKNSLVCTVLSVKGNAPAVLSLPSLFLCLGHGSLTLSGTVEGLLRPSQFDDRLKLLIQYLFSLNVLDNVLPLT